MWLNEARRFLSSTRSNGFNELLRATDAIHGETETAQDLRFLLGAGSPLGGARPKSSVSLAGQGIAIALAAAPRFGLKATESMKILREVFTTVSGWRKTGRQLGLKPTVLDACASAFEHPLLEETRRLLGK